MACSYFADIKLSFNNITKHFTIDSNTQFIRCFADKLDDRLNGFTLKIPLFTILDQSIDFRK